MARRNIRINIPRSSPTKLLALLQKILDKHDAIGAASPLDAAKMTALQAVYDQAKLKHTAAETARKNAEAAMELAYQALGIGVGQTALTKGTCYNLLLNTRDRLLNTYEDTPEELGTFGFDVVVGSSGGSKKTTPPA